MKPTSVTFIVVLFLVIAHYSIAQIDEKLYYPLDGVNNGSVLDESGNQNHGFSFNIISVEDRNQKPDAAIYMNGFNSKIIFDGKPFDFDEYSYSLWVKLVEMPGNEEAGFIIDIGSDYGVDQYIAVVNNYSFYNLYGFLAQGYNMDGTTTFLCDNELFNLHEWHFLVYTRTMNKACLYLNTLKVAEEDIPEKLPIYGESIKGRLGCRNTEQQYFKGYLDEVRIFDYELNQSEIDSLYQYATHINTNESDDSKLVLSPNPVDHLLKINYPGIGKSNVEYWVYTIYGALKARGTETTLDVSTLSQGMYVLRLRDKTNDKIHVGKFVVRH